MTRKRKASATDESVALVVRDDGLAAARGSGFARLGPDGQEAVLALEAAASHRRAIEAEIGLLVADARRGGASWFQIGVSLGTTGEAARKRYLYEQEDEA